MSAAVDVVDAEDVVAVFKQVGHSNVGSHARRARDRVFGVFHACKGAFEAGTSWISAAGVIEDNRVSRRWLGEGRTQVNSWRHTAKDLIWFIACVN